jgi:hypothetical protein
MMCNENIQGPDFDVEESRLCTDTKLAPDWVNNCLSECVERAQESLGFPTRKNCPVESCVKCIDQTVMFRSEISKNPKTGTITEEEWDTLVEDYMDHTK